MDGQYYALLIDADNVSAKYIKPILTELSKYGNITYKRIYGDWTSTQHSSWKDELLKNSIMPIQQFSYTQGKNATDSAMIIDAMDILYTNAIDGFCIVSSDSDFTRLVSRLRESGKTVIGMGENKTPEPFRKACDKFTILENLLNEAAIIAAKDNRMFIQQKDIRHAFVKVGIGAEKKSRIVSEKERKITAYHEAGHAILFHVLPDVGPVYSVSIIPTGGAGGYTMPLPEKDEMFNTKGQMLQEITVSLGGRVAEEEIFDDITTGASQDIKQATAIAKSMITKFGMSERLGLINYDNDSDEVFIGRDFGHTSRGYGEKIAGTIDEEVKRIIDECYAKARSILEEYHDVLEACAKLLLEKEKITRSEFEALFEDGVSEEG